MPLPKGTRTRYVHVLFKSSREHGVAYFATEERFLLPDVGNVEAWQPLLGVLRRGRFCDYLASDLGVRLCSPLVRNILDESATPADDLQWLPAEVASSQGSPRSYFILHFPSQLDVIDRSKSLMAGDVVVRPLLRAERFVGHSVFTYQGGGGITLYLRGDVERRLKAAGCTGLQFSGVLRA
jgi:hypothetical protein